MERNEVLRGFGQRLRELRIASGMTQEELAYAAAVDRGYISESESGNRNPSIWIIYRLAEALGMEPGRLLPEIDGESPKQD
jgi:transcriptional regulator with XRE-family HTH domain